MLVACAGSERRPPRPSPQRRRATRSAGQLSPRAHPSLPHGAPSAASRRAAPHRAAALACRLDRPTDRLPTSARARLAPRPTSPAHLRPPDRPDRPNSDLRLTSSIPGSPRCRAFARTYAHARLHCYHAPPVFCGAPPAPRPLLCCWFARAAVPLRAWSQKLPEST